MFGMALREPFDIIEARRTEEKRVVIERIEGRGADIITKASRRNSASLAAMAVLERGKADFGIVLKIKKGIRPCSGIGSSGASAAGGAFAANLLMDKPLTSKEVVQCAAKAEPNGHADNVSPSVLGGFTIIRSYDPFEVLQVKPPSNLGVVVAMPNFMVSTREARKVIPSSVGLKAMISHVGNASSLVLGMTNGDVELIGRSIIDKVIEPSRARLVPYLREVQAAAIEKGAVGTFLGGSGPCSIAFFNTDNNNGTAIAASMSSVYQDHGIKCETWITSWGEGCRRQ